MEQPSTNYSVEDIIRNSELSNRMFKLLETEFGYNTLPIKNNEDEDVFLTRHCSPIYDERGVMIGIREAIYDVLYEELDVEDEDFSKHKILKEVIIDKDELKENLCRITRRYEVSKIVIDETIDKLSGITASSIKTIGRLFKYKQEIIEDLKLINKFRKLYESN